MPELLWMIQEGVLDGCIQQMLAGAPGLPSIGGRFPAADVIARMGDDESTQLYRKAGDIALINVSGPLTKQHDIFSRWLGGSSLLDIRAAVQAAAADESVSAILMRIYSPGGTVAGTCDCGDAIFAARQKKPVWAYIEDLGASGAYWLSSQATRVIANPTAVVGSIGTYIVLHDFSKALTEAGIKTLVVRAGEFKGAGSFGAEITEEQIKEFQNITNNLNEHFLAAVARGRNMNITDVRKIADGRVHIGEKAMAIGLIDGVGTLDSTIAQLRSAASPSRSARVSHTPTTSTPLQDGEPNMKFNKHQMALMMSWGLAADADAKAALEYYQKLEAAQKTLIDDLASFQGPPPQANPTPPQRPREQSSRRSDDDDDPPSTPDVNAVVEQALARDSQRRSDIRALFQRFESRGYELSALRDQLVEDRSCTVEQAREKLLAHIEENQPRVTTGGVTVGPSQRDKFLTLADSGLLIRAGIESEYVYDHSTHRLRHDAAAAQQARRDAEANGLAVGLQGLAKHCLAMNGVRGAWQMEGEDLYAAVASAGAFNMSTSDFPLILEASANKMLQRAYEHAPTTFQVWAGEGSVKNFNTHKKLRFSEAPLLRKRLEGAPAQHGYFSEERETFSADEFALAIGFTRRMMVNDDLNAVVDMVSSLGEGVKFTIEDELWTNTMALNSYLGPTMGDGVTLFHTASHGNNAGSGAVPSQDTLKTGIISMASITGFGQDGTKVTIANLPKFFLGSMTDALLAEAVINAQFANDDDRRSPQHSKIRQLVPVDVPHLTVNGERDWYLTGPKERSPVQVSYLNGNKSPRLRRIEGTTVAGIQYVLEFDVGVDAVDWRRGYRNPGA